MTEPELEAARRDPSRQFTDRYVLLRELGRGAFGVVHEAWDERLGRPVALKLLLRADARARERFGREAAALARLRHPGIVPIFERDERDGTPYIAMQYVQGRTLLDAISARDLPTEGAAAILREVAEAVHEAHQQGILHRDLKPQNVLLDEKGRPLVADFGMARVEDATGALTVEGAAMGTPAYMPPEQASGKLAEIDARSDVYALGATLYHALAGVPPFQAPSHAGMILATLRDRPRPPSEHDPRVPAALDDVCLRALEKEPARRYPSAAAFAEAIDAALEKARGGAHGPSDSEKAVDAKSHARARRSDRLRQSSSSGRLRTPTDPRSSSSRKSGAGVVVAGAMGVVVLAVGATLLRGSAQPPPSPVAAAPPVSRSKPPPRSATVPTRDQLEAILRDFYATRGEHAGVFRMARVRRLRLDGPRSGVLEAHVEYDYEPIAGNPQGRDDAGVDTRVFALWLVDRAYVVKTMGPYGSGRFEDLQQPARVTEPEPIQATTDATALEPSPPPVAAGSVLDSAVKNTGPPAELGPVADADGTAEDAVAVRPVATEAAPAPATDRAPPASDRPPPKPPADEAVVAGAVRIESQAPAFRLERPSDSWVVHDVAVLERLARERGQDTAGFNGLKGRFAQPALGAFLELSALLDPYTRTKPLAPTDLAENYTAATLALFVNGRVVQQGATRVGARQGWTYEIHGRRRGWEAPYDGDRILVRTIICRAEDRQIFILALEGPLEAAKELKREYQRFLASARL